MKSIYHYFVPEGQDAGSSSSTKMALSYSPHPSVLAGHAPVYDIHGKTNTIQIFLDAMAYSITRPRQGILSSANDD